MGAFPGKVESAGLVEGSRFEDGIKVSAILLGIFPFLKTQPGFKSRNPTSHMPCVQELGFAVAEE